MTTGATCGDCVARYCGTDWGNGGTDRAQGSRADGHDRRWSPILFFFIFCIYACSHGRDCERTRRFSSPGGGPPPCKLSGPRVANRSTAPGEIRGPAGPPDGARHSFSMHGRAWKLELGIPATGRSFWKIFVHGDPSERAPRRHGAPFVIPPLRGTVRRPDCFIPHAE